VFRLTTTVPDASAQYIAINHQEPPHQASVQCWTLQQQEHQVQQKPPHQVQQEQQVQQVQQVQPPDQVQQKPQPPDQVQQRLNMYMHDHTYMQNTG